MTSSCVKNFINSLHHCIYSYSLSIVPGHPITGKVCSSFNSLAPVKEPSPHITTQPSTSLFFSCSAPLALHLADLSPVPPLPSALIAVFIPGESPPYVNTAMRFID